MKEMYKCPKCEHEMEKGIMLDTAGSLGEYISSSWMEEFENPSQFWGWYGVIRQNDVKANRVYQIKALRCAECGFVELYAPK